MVLYVLGIVEWLFYIPAYFAYRAARRVAVGSIALACRRRTGSSRRHGAHGTIRLTPHRM